MFIDSVGARKCHLLRCDDGYLQLTAITDGTPEGTDDIEVHTMLSKHTVFVP